MLSTILPALPAHFSPGQAATPALARAFIADLASVVLLGAPAEKAEVAPADGSARLAAEDFDGVARQHRAEPLPFAACSLVPWARTRFRTRPARRRPRAAGTNHTRPDEARND